MQLQRLFAVLLVIMGVMTQHLSIAATPLVATAVLKSPITHLYFRGVLYPINNTPLLSPVDGSVIATHFVYGQAVKQGSVLLELDAAQLSTAYRTALSDYLQKKSELETQQLKFNGDRALFKAGVIAKQDVENSQNSYLASLVSLTQSRFELKKILDTVHMDFSAIEKLELAQAKPVAAALQQSFSHLKVTSPVDGVVLIPLASSNSSDELKDKPLSAGDSVKSLQPLLSLGDLSGFTVMIKVSELAVAQLKVGLPATISGDAFPATTLHGVIKRVAVQANPNQMAGEEGGLSMYSAVVEIPNVPQAVRQNLRVGMSARVDVQIKQAAAVMVPLDAVLVKQGKTYVTVIDPDTHKKQDVPVETGETTATDINISSGLVAGSQVVVYHHEHTSVDDD